MNRTKFDNFDKLKNYIFIKNVNNKYKLVPFNIKENYVGYTKYSPADSKEWKNKVYFFNHNHLKDLPVHDINVYKILKSYFNLYFFNKVILKKHVLKRVKRLSLNKIYISKPEIKHTNYKTIITIYIFNREKISLIKNIKRLNLNYNKLENFKHKLLNNNFYLGYLNKNFNNLKIELLLKKKLKDQLKKFYFNVVNYKIFKFILYKNLIFYRELKFKFSLNKFKFHNILLYRLGIFIRKIYHKKIEFNIINLQSIALNTDIFTEFLKRKIKRKRMNVGKVMNFVLARVRLPEENSIIARGRITKTIDFNLLENKYKNLNINSIINKYISLDNILNNISFKGKFPISKIILFQKKIILLKKKIFFEIKKIIFDYIKYKNIAGIRIEVKGRLTKRYRADRSVYRVRWKGGLKNTDSAFKGLSTVTFRGYANSNVEYSIRTSKRRIGAFAVKGWISGK